MITIGDMVRAQARVIDHLGIGSSFSPCSAARWAGCRCCNGRRPIRSACSRRLPIACAARHSAQNIAFHEVGRQAIMADPDWRWGGNYALEGLNPPAASRSRAWRRISRIFRKPRCIASSAATCRTAPKVTYGFDADFQVEAISATGARSSSTGSTRILSLYHPGDGLFRPRHRARRATGERLQGHPKTRFCVVSFTSDWLFPDPGKPRHRPCVLNACAANVSFVEIESDKGHDAFPAGRPGSSR